MRSGAIPDPVNQEVTESTLSWLFHIRFGRMNTAGQNADLGENISMISLALQC